jgi:hypothetical protein
MGWINREKVFMKSRLVHISMLAVLLVALMSSPLPGQVMDGQAQAGTEWSAPVNLSNSGASKDPSIVIDNQGVIHVIWLDTVDGYKYVQSRDGVTWSKPVAVDFPFDPIKDSRPKLVADASGSIHIFWTRVVVTKVENAGEQDSNNLMYARAGANFLSQPLSWASVDKLADSVLDFDVAGDARSSIHLAFVGDRAINNDPAGIFYRRLEGKSWTPVVSLYSSQYFRTLALEDSHVRVAASGGGVTGNVYIVWDDRSVKRNFLAKSTDGGRKWDESVQLRGPEDTSGLSLPYNTNVNVTGKNVLLTWQLGQPGSLCSQYSQWSVDGAATLSEPKRLSDEPISCPARGSFVGTNPGYFTMLLDIFGDLSLLAWNGTDWSPLQSQPEITTFSNSLTLGSVILGCRQVTTYADKIYVVGCDETGGDIWFRYRRLGSLNDWFPPASAWTGPVPVARVNQEISSSAVVADSKNGFHAFWMQHGTDASSENPATLQYMKWENGGWSTPINVINEIAGVPHFLSTSSDPQGGVLLAWVEGVNGEIYFSRAPGDKAYLGAEWSAPVRIPSLSDLNTAPDMVTDSSNRITLVYSVPYNENRGIYLVQSNDQGRNWSAPVRIFDAVALNWDSVTQPKIGLSADGRLHVLVTRISLREAGQVASLYYTQSQDGGGTWTTPEAMNDGSVLWSEIVHTGSNVLFRLWQEQNGDVYESFSEESRDGGLSWSGRLKFSSIAGNPTQISVARDADGQLYVAQAQTVGKSVVLDEIIWDGGRWIAHEMKGLVLEQDLDRAFIDAGLTPDGTLHFLASLDYVGSDETSENVIYAYNRQLEVINNLQSQPSGLIPTRVPGQPTVSPETSLTPTQRSPLQVIEDASNAARLRNTIGFALLAGIVILTLLIIRPRKK